MSRHAREGWLRCKRGDTDAERRSRSRRSESACTAAGEPGRPPPLDPLVAPPLPAGTVSGVPQLELNGSARLPLLS
jgi:hypothetical protein